MEETKKYLEKWLNALNSFSYQSYEELPDIDLYMDQIVTYLERQLQIFQTSSLDKQITSSMINNYVKGELVTPPLKKKYNKEHLAIIEEICTLKQVLSIAEVKQIIDKRYKNVVEKADVFNSFNQTNNEKVAESVETAFKKINDMEECNTKELIDLALDFSLTANAYINISKRILYLIRILEAKETEAKRIKETDKE